MAMLRIFAIIVATAAAAEAFSAPSLHPSGVTSRSKRACIPLRMSASASSGPQTTRRAFGSLAIAGAAAVVLMPSNEAKADITVRGDGKWAEHQGKFDVEKELTEGFITTESGLKYKDIKVGEGELPKEGQVVFTDYSGYTLESGARWGTTYGSPQPRSIRAGARPNQKIMAGLNEGLATMKKGGKRILVLPSKLGYNFMSIKNDAKPDEDIIPAFSSLVCYVEVVGFGQEEEKPPAK